MERLNKCSELLFDFLEGNPENLRNVTSNIRKNKCLDFNLPNFSMSSVPYPLSNNSSQSNCKLINTKKDKKYIHQYNITHIVEHIQNFQPPVADEYVNEFNKIIDTKIYENCCNCISIVLYSNLSMHSLAVYLSCIYFSVKNVELFLNDWIVRIYMDNSVYFALNISDDINMLFHYHYIVRSLNVEIYTYICKELIIPTADDDYEEKEISYDKEVAQSRFLRFLPLIDHTVNTCIIREADGIVSALDCHNISVFSKSNKIFYISNLDVYYSHVKRIQPFISYSKWLTIYKSCIDQDYFAHYNNTYDLLAGMIGFNIKIKPEEFNKTIISAKNSTIRSDVIYCALQNNIVFSEDRVNSALNIGFDEIFLLSLFRGLISCKYTKIDNSINADKHQVEYKYTYQRDELALILSTIISKDTIMRNFLIELDVNVNTDKNWVATGGTMKYLVKIMKQDDTKFVFDVYPFVENIKNVTGSNINVDEIVNLINSVIPEQIFRIESDSQPIDLDYIFDYITDLLIYYIVRNTNEPVSYELKYGSLDWIGIKSEWGYILNNKLKKSLIFPIENINNAFAKYFGAE